MEIKTIIATYFDELLKETSFQKSLNSKINNLMETCLHEAKNEMKSRNSLKDSISYLNRHYFNCYEEYEFKLDIGKFCLANDKVKDYNFIKEHIDEINEQINFEFVKNKIIKYINKICETYSKYGFNLEFEHNFLRFADLKTGLFLKFKFAIIVKLEHKIRLIHNRIVHSLKGKYKDIFLLCKKTKIKINDFDIKCMDYSFNILKREYLSDNTIDEIKFILLKYLSDKFSKSESLQFDNIEIYLSNQYLSELSRNSRRLFNNSSKLETYFTFNGLSKFHYANLKNLIEEKLSDFINYCEKEMNIKIKIVNVEFKSITFSTK